MQVQPSNGLPRKEDFNGADAPIELVYKMNLLDILDYNHDRKDHVDVKDKLERVRLLVDQGADKEIVDSDGYSPLHLASIQGYLDVAQYLVEEGATLDKLDHTGNTPLSVAAVNGQLEICRYLLEQGADRGKPDHGGYTPLHYAACYGRPEIAKLLMIYGAELNANDQLAADIAGDDMFFQIDPALTEEIKQAIRDEPRRRMDEAPGKRATEDDRHPNATSSASTQQEEKDDEEVAEEELSNKKPRLDEGTGVEEETKVASEDEDSEPSSDEDDAK